MPILPAVGLVGSFKTAGVDIALIDTVWVGP